MKNGLFWTKQFYYSLCYQDTMALKTSFSKQISRQSVKGNASILFYRVIQVTLKQLYGPLIFVQVKDCLHTFWRHTVDIQHCVKRGTFFFFLLKSFSSFSHQESGKLRSTKTPRNSFECSCFLLPQRSYPIHGKHLTEPSILSLSSKDSYFTWLDTNSGFIRWVSASRVKLNL